MSLSSTADGRLEIDGTAAAAISTGAYTLAVLYKRPPAGNNTMVVTAYSADNFGRRGLNIDSGDLYSTFGNGGVADSNLAVDAWYWLVISKSAATEYVRFHYAQYAASGSLSWTHVDGTTWGEQGDSSAIDRLFLGDPYGGAFLGEFAVLAAHTTEMSDAAVETAFAQTAQAAYDAAPASLVVAPQASAASPLPDLMGGSGETTRTGTWTVTADPDSFDYTIGGAPVNIPPTVSTGANRSIYLGQSTTLTATASDSDGTVASIDWFQTSGPTATLTGTGASRTFTPSETGVYVFTTVATDDEGADSAPSSVTITVLAVPVDPEPTEGTAQPVAKIGSVERALMALFVRDLEVLEGVDTRIGGEFPRVVDDFYVRLDRVPGGRATSFEGDFVVDIEVFSEDYLRAEDISEDIEVLLLAHGYHTVVSGGKKWVFDGIFQNTAITDLPWAGDDDTHRLMATYALTVRRGRV